jgi:hypothetical protein
MPEPTCDSAAMAAILEERGLVQRKKKRKSHTLDSCLDEDLLDDLELYKQPTMVVLCTSIRVSGLFEG